LHCGKKGERAGTKGEICRMMRVSIQFEPRLSKKKKGSGYSYRLMARRLPKSEKEAG
jgi:hypothetical protein